MIDALKVIQDEALGRLEKLGAEPAESDLRDLRARYLGREGALTVALRGMGKLPASERPKVGQAANMASRTASTSVFSRRARSSAVAPPSQKPRSDSQKARCEP